MAYTDNYNLTSTTDEDLDARLMAIAVNAVKESARAKGRDDQFTDNDMRTAMAINKMLIGISGLVDDVYQPMPMAIKGRDTVKPLIDKVYNILDKDIGDAVVERVQPIQPTVDTDKKPSKGHNPT